MTEITGKRLRLVDAGVGQTSNINWDWIGLNKVEPLQKKASGTPGGKDIEMFHGKGSGPKLTCGYNDDSQKGYVHMEKGYEEMFRDPKFDNGEASFRYYGFMNANGYHYFMNWHLYNDGSYLYPAPLRGFNCKISVGANDGSTSWGCKYNYGDYTQINKVWGLFRHTNGSYRVWELKNLIDDGQFSNSTIKSNSYALKNVSVTSTNSKINKYLPCGQSKTLALGVPYTVTESTLRSYKFCGFSMSVCISNHASSKRCHTFKINNITPLPLGANPSGSTNGSKLILYGERIRYNESYRNQSIKLRYHATDDN